MYAFINMLLEQIRAVVQAIMTLAPFILCAVAAVASVWCIRNVPHIVRVKALALRVRIIRAVLPGNYHFFTDREYLDKKQELRGEIRKDMEAQYVMQETAKLTELHEQYFKLITYLARAGATRKVSPEGGHEWSVNGSPILSLIKPGELNRYERGKWGQISLRTACTIAQNAAKYPHCSTNMLAAEMSRVAKKLPPVPGSSNTRKKSSKKSPKADLTSPAVTNNDKPGNVYMTSSGELCVSWD